MRGSPEVGIPDPARPRRLKPALYINLNPSTVTRTLKRALYI